MRGMIAIILAVAFFGISTIAILIIVSMNDTRKVKFITPNPPPILSPPNDCQPTIPPPVTLPPRPDFSTLPPGSITVQSSTNARSPVTIARGGYVDLIVSSANGSDIIILVPASNSNTTGTAIRIRNTGTSGSAIFTPTSGVILLPPSDPNVTPGTTAYFTAVNLNTYIRN